MEIIAITVIVMTILHLLQYRAAQSKAGKLRSEFRDAEMRQKNAESVAMKCAQIKQEQHEMMLKHGLVRCHKCGRFTPYSKAYTNYQVKGFNCYNCITATKEQINGSL